MCAEAKGVSVQNGYNIEMELNKLYCAVVWIELDEAHKCRTNEKMRLFQVQLQFNDETSTPPPSQTLTHARFFLATQFFVHCQWVNRESLYSGDDILSQNAVYLSTILTYWCGKPWHINMNNLQMNLAKRKKQKKNT